MARKRVVSRTITETEATVLYANAADQTFINRVLRVQGEYTNADDLMKVIKKKHNQPGLVAISLLSTRKMDTLYEMDEDEFIRLARIVPGGR